jgi:hypothetical protein
MSVLVGQPGFDFVNDLTNYWRIRISRLHAEYQKMGSLQSRILSLTVIMRFFGAG